MSTTVKPIRFRDEELEKIRVAAEAAKMPLNRWVRRACREAAALEAAVAEPAAPVGVPAGSSVAPLPTLAATRHLNEFRGSAFKPDFGKRLKGAK